MFSTIARDCLYLVNVCAFLTTVIFEFYDQNVSIYTVLQTSFRTLQYNTAFFFSQGDVLVCFSKPFFDVN